jgi:predicted AlkP superfamily phosphohydrolase/phosphomutase
MPPLLILGIDAASPELLRRWTTDGTLPNLARLSRRAVTGAVAGLEGFFIGSTWPTLYTGVTPARHGLQWPEQLEPGTYRQRRMADLGLVRRETLWGSASRAGRRVAVLDVPMAPPEPDLNGIQIVEWGGHDSVYGFLTSPPELARDVVSRYGSHPAGPSCDGTRLSAGDHREFVDSLLMGIERKKALTLDVWRKEAWDLFVQVFTEAHCCGHQCWHLHDPSHPAHDPAVAEAVGDPLRQVYVAIDEAVGAILEEAGDSTVIVLAAHGMSYWYGAQFLLQKILVSLGVTTPPPPPQPAPPSPLARAADAMSTWAPAPFKRSARRLRDRLATPSPGTEPALPFAPATSACFPVRNGLAVGGIRLNVVGREPQGLLQPGDEVNRFCSQLAADLLEIVDERTGGRLVRRVLRADELYEGGFLDELPDLLVEWSDEVPTGSTRLADGAGAAVRASSPKLGVVEGSNHYTRTGENRPGGLFFATGPGLTPARLERTVALTDFVPTFAAMLGLGPGDWDGEPIDEIIVAGAGGF